MMGPTRVQAWVDGREPWTDSHGIVLGWSDSGGSHFATGVADGRIVYETGPEGTEAPRFLSLSESEFEALARAFLNERRPEDATTAALKDAQTVRDRLLVLVERVVSA